MIGWLLWRPGPPGCQCALGQVPGTLASLPLKACGQLSRPCPPGRVDEIPLPAPVALVSARITPFMGVLTFLQPWQTFPEQLPTTLLSSGLTWSFLHL